MDKQWYRSIIVRASEMNENRRDINATENYSSNFETCAPSRWHIGVRAYPSIRGTSVRILLITSSLCWCVTGADCRSNGRQSPPRRRAATRSKMGANTRHLLRGLSSLRSLLLPLLGESSHGGGSRTVPLHGATSGSSVRHVVWNGNTPSKLLSSRVSFHLVHDSLLPFLQIYFKRMKKEKVELKCNKQERG